MSRWGQGRIKRVRSDIYFSDYIRIRDNWCCMKCGKKFIQGVDSQRLHCAHVWFGRANLSTRWEPINCLSLCMGCHNTLDQHPAYAWELLSKHRTVEEIMWLQQQKDEKLTIKIPEKLEREEREKIKVMLKDLKEERGNGSSISKGTGRRNKKGDN